MDYKEIAVLLADHIIDMWTTCPIDEYVTVRHCDGWRCEHCRNCIVKHAHELTKI